MSNIAEIVGRLIAAGTPPDIAAMAVTDAFAAGAATVAPQNFGGNSTENQTDLTAERRRAKDRERYKLRRKSTETAENPPKSTEIQNAPLSILSLTDTDSSKKTKKDSERRGSRIPPDWKLSQADIDFAQSKGMPRGRMDTEAEKFRNHWLSKPGKAGFKLDWPATWRTWVINWLDYNPPSKRSDDHQYVDPRL